MANLNALVHGFMSTEGTGLVNKDKQLQESGTGAMAFWQIVLPLLDYIP